MPHRTPNTNPRGPWVKDIADGYELIARAAVTWADAKATLASASAAMEKAEARLLRLLQFKERHRKSKPRPQTQPPIPIRLALILAENPRVDYQRVADRIWGPGLPFAMAKNRVSTHLAILRKLGVVETRGSNVHEVDATRLAELTRRKGPS